MCSECWGEAKVGNSQLVLATDLDYSYDDGAGQTRTAGWSYAATLSRVTLIAKGVNAILAGWTEAELLAALSPGEYFLLATGCCPRAWSFILKDPAEDGAGSVSYASVSNPSEDASGSYLLQATPRLSVAGSGCRRDYVGADAVILGAPIGGGYYGRRLDPATIVGNEINLGLNIPFALGLPSDTDYPLTLTTFTNPMAADFGGPWSASGSWVGDPDYTSTFSLSVTAS